MYFSHERRKNVTKINLTGLKFNHLTVIREYDKSSNGNVRYLCICDCGNYSLVRSNRLRNGSAKSCGRYALCLVSFKKKNLEQYYYSYRVK